MPADGAMSAHPAGWHWGKLDPIVIEAVRTPSGTWVSPEAQQMQRGLEESGTRYAESPAQGPGQAAAGAGEGKGQVITADGDRPVVEITATETTATLHYADGRPPARLRARQITNVCLCDLDLEALARLRVDVRGVARETVWH